MKQQAVTEAPVPAGITGLSHQLIGSGAWVLPLVFAVFVVYREFKKEMGRGLRALGVLMLVGSAIIVLPEFGTLLLALSVLALIIGVITSHH